MRWCYTIPVYLEGGGVGVGGGWAYLLLMVLTNILSDKKLKNEPSSYHAQGCRHNNLKRRHADMTVVYMGLPTRDSFCRYPACHHINK